MKNILIIPLLIIGLWACNNDEAGIVHVDLQPSQAFSFNPKPGGAVMHYILPANPDITGIQVHYNDAFGQKIIRSGSTSCDTLELIGFNEKKDRIPAQVFLCFYDNRKSQPFDVTFSTHDSGPITFLKNVNVFPNWEGFSIQFDNPEKISGMAHIFYLGIDPVNQLPDTILINSFLLEKTDGLETRDFHIQQEIKDPTIIIRAEDFRGYIVGEKGWEKIKTLFSEKLASNKFSFFCDRSIEHEGHKLGIKYLFDGDKKGEILFEEGNKGKCCTFLAGPNSAGENAVPMYIDLKTNHVVASIRIYSMFNNRNSPSWKDPLDPGGMTLVAEDEEAEMPCEVTIYGLKDNHQNPTKFEEIDCWKNWIQIGKFKQDKKLDLKKRWCKSCLIIHPKRSLEDIQNAEEEYMEIIIPAIEQAEGYRYLKMVINEHFEYFPRGGRPKPIYYNPYNYILIHELEVYTKKDQ